MCVCMLACVHAGVHAGVHACVCVPLFSLQKPSEIHDALQCCHYRSVATGLANYCSAMLEFIKSGVVRGRLEVGLA